ncbi:hypothetical protein Tco_0024041 [Tanacetum coccineum]
MPYPSRRYGVSVHGLTKDHKRNKPIRRIQKKAIRRIKDIVCEDSGRYQAWSLLQETPIRRIQSLGYAIIIIRASQLKMELQEIMTESIYEGMEKAPNETIISITSNEITIEHNKEFLVKLQDNTYHGTLNEDVVEHIAKVLEMVDLIYAPGTDSHQLRIKVFPFSLASDANKWWINEGDEKITTWEELVEKFFCRFYPESNDREDEMLDEGED